MTDQELIEKLRDLADWFPAPDDETLYLAADRIQELTKEQVPDSVFRSRGRERNGI